MCSSFISPVLRTGLIYVFEGQYVDIPLTTYLFEMFPRKRHVGVTSLYFNEVTSTHVETVTCFKKTDS